MVKRSSQVEYLLKNNKSVLVLGPRGIGKSFYINRLLGAFENTIKIDLLNSGLFSRYLNTPAQLFNEIQLYLQQHNHCLVFIDEIQRIPCLLNEVHRLLEEFPGQCTFALTGSSARKLKREQANLLAGRAIYLPFHPFTHQEVDFSVNMSKILQFGTLPTAFLEPDPILVRKYLFTYTDIYLKEEVLQEALVRNIDGFSRFLEIAAFDNGNPVNLSRIARQVKMSITSIKSHYQILRDTLLVTRIPAWSYSIRKQLQQAAKYYFFDNGVLNSLTGELATELRPSSYRYGRLFENLVINEIIRFIQHHDLPHKLYHYRTNHGVEIDLIIQSSPGKSPVALEIKSGTQPQFRDVRQLVTILDEEPRARCFVLCQTPMPYEERGVVFLPFPRGLPEIFGVD